MSVDSQNMVSIPIKDLFNGLSLPVDLYVQLSENKFICVCNAGTKIDQSQLVKYTEKNIDSLWIDKDSFGKITDQTLRLTHLVLDQAHVPAEKKLGVIASASSIIFKELALSGLNAAIYDRVKDITASTITLLEEVSDFSNVLNTMSSLSNDQIRHATVVSSTSVLIAKEMGWTNRSTLEKLALGGLLHDIGLLLLPEELTSKAKSDMTRKELETYESHCEKGVELLKTLSTASEDVIAIVREHHEFADGSGYPNKIKNLKQHPMSKLVAMANVFTDLTLKTELTPNPMTPLEALSYIDKNMQQCFNKEVFGGLIAVIRRESLRSTGTGSR